MEEVAHAAGLLVRGEQGRKGQEAGKNRKKKKKVQCYKCGEWGYWKRDCPELNGGSSVNIAARGDDSSSDGEALLVADGVMETGVTGLTQVFHGGGEPEEDSSGSPL